MLLVRLRRAKARPFWENLILMALAIFVTLMGLEFYFKVFFAETDDLDTLARDNWRKLYYKDTFNTFGYRDKEWSDEMVAGKTKVIVVGDSFVEGAGIKYTKDRFPDRLDEMLGSDYVVFNVGRRGASTEREMNDLLEYPYSPNILILSYFVNDIDEIAVFREIMEPPKMPPISPVLSPLVNNSYAVNFFYWRVVRIAAAREPDERWLWRLRAYNDPDAWWLHQQQLLAIAEGAKSEQIPFIVVVFPSMTNLEDSLPIAERVVELFEKQGIPVLDVADLIQGIPSKELTASAVDAHPNEMVHELVAKALYDMFVELELVK